MKPIIVLGSGLAGYTVVRELRKLNRETPVTMLSQATATTHPNRCSPMPLHKARHPPRWC